MKSIYFLIAALAAALLVPNELAAQSTGETVTFEELDTDNDGFISVREASDHEQLLNQWTEIDTNTNGKLEAAEFKAFEMAPGGGDEDNPEIGTTPTPE